jgi:serine/threonine protein kinase
MSLCINPRCPQPENSAKLLFCVGCSSSLLLVNKYRVVKLMSDKGGFGNTYEMSKDGIAKVLKVLKSNDDVSIGLFNREFEVLKYLNGQGVKGIPHVEDLFSYNHNSSSEPLHCLVMERIYGENLEEYIKKINNYIDETTALLWLSKLTQILKEIHGNRIFHRDIKPSNIILQPDGHQPVLIDFGAAKQAAQNASKPGTQIFTPGYAAPEQQLVGQASAKSDFFSLGRTFVYLLTKQEPLNLSNNTSQQCEWRHLTNNISPGLLDLIDRLMQLDPDCRPEYSDAILTEIELLSKKNQQILPQPIGQNKISQQNPISNISHPISIANNSSNSKTTVINNRNNGLYTSSFKLILLFLLLSSVVLFTIWRIVHQGSSSVKFNDVTGIPTGEFRFGGSTTFATTRHPDIAIDIQIKEFFRDYKIRYIDNNSPNDKIESIYNNKCPIGPGSEAGICWLIEKDLDFVQSSISLDKSKYTQGAASKDLKEEEVAYDAVTFVVNHQLNISALSKQQLRDIYTGKITNWKEVGGQDLLIHPISRAESSGTVASFKELILKDGDKIKANVVTHTTKGLQQVIDRPGGIYYGAAKEVIFDSCGTKPIAIVNDRGTAIKPYQEPLQSYDACNKGRKNKINIEVIKNQTYPLTRKIYIIIKADGSDRQKAGEAYAKLLKTKQGQDLLERAGFVRIGD